MKTRIEQQSSNITEEVQECCDGYVKMLNNDKCLPICENSCVYGNCTAPNVCTCYEGYEARPEKPNV